MYKFLKKFRTYISFYYYYFYLISFILFIRFNYAYKSFKKMIKRKRKLNSNYKLQQEEL